MNTVRHTRSTLLRNSCEGLILLGLATAASARVIFRPGWPYNHEGLGMFERTEALRRAWVAGEWFASWTPYCFDGFGSAHPLFYHRLFNRIAAALGWLFGGTDGGVRAAIPVLLAIGAWGMLRFCRTVLEDVPRSAMWTPWLGAWLFIFAPYFWLDWLVRGALAEFTAMALVPWFLREIVFFMRANARPVRIAVLATLIFHAHSVIAYYLYWLAIVVVAVGVTVGTPRVSGAFADLRTKWKAWVACLTIIVAAVGPFVLASLRSIPYFDVGYLTQPSYQPMNNLQAAGNYLRHFTFRWGEQYQGVSVEIQRFVLIAFGIVSAVGWRLRRRWVANSMGALLGGFVFLIWLQTSTSEVFYQSVPKAAFLQFPWRLLTFIVPLTIVGLVRWMGLIQQDGTDRYRFTSWVGIAAALSVLIIPVSALRLDYGAHNQATLDTSIRQLDGPPSPEYVPRSQSTQYWRAKAEGKTKRPLVDLGDCVSNGPVPIDFSAMELRLRFRNPSPCKISVRQFPSPLLAVEVRGGRVVDPEGGLGMSFHLDQGEGEVRVRRRSLLEVAFGQWGSSP